MGIFGNSTRFEDIFNLDKNNELRDKRVSWKDFFNRYPEIFKTDVFRLEGVYNDPNFPMQVKYPQQLRLFQKIYGDFYRKGEIIDCKDVISLYQENPNWFLEMPYFCLCEQLEIEVTNDCNLNCIMCPRQKMTREIGNMDFDLFKKIVDETGASSIHFSGLGEPLLHPKIMDMFTYAKEQGGGLEIGLWTSGIDLSEDISKEIIEKELVDYIILGLDAATKDTYLKVKGVDVFDKATENITRFLKLKKEKVAEMEKDVLGWWNKIRPIVGIQILKMKETDPEIEEFMNKWDYMDKVKKMINYRNRSQELDKMEDNSKRMQASLKLTKELWETFYTKAELPVEHAIIGHFDNYCGQIEDRSVIDVTPLKRFPCRQLNEGISILWNGNVVLCRQDFDGKYSLWNLREQNLVDILEGKRLEDIWQAHKDGKYDKLPHCKDCKEWYYNFYG